MNKEKTLAAHRIKTKLAEAVKVKTVARNKIAIAESKVKKVSEAFDAAKKIVDKQKETLELAKKQILEKREVIKRLESLLDIKYGQQKDLISKCAALEAKQKENESKISKNESNISNKLKAYQKRCQILENRIKKLLEDKEFKSKVISQDDQVVKKADARKAKVEAIKAAIAKRLAEKSDIPTKELSRKKAKISKVYSNKFGISETFANHILDKHGISEGLVRLQKIANRKSASKKSESRISMMRKMKNSKKLTESKSRVSMMQKMKNSKKLTESKSRVSMMQKMKNNSDTILNESDAKKFAEIYARKYRMPETASMKILTKYPKNEAIAKLQSVANELVKYSNESKTTGKVNESKVKTNESLESEGTSLYSLFS